MSTYIPELDQRNRPQAGQTSEDPDVAVWEERRRAAATDRRRYEPGWELCQAFISGKQWVGWDKTTGRVVELPNPQERIRHTVNVIAGYFWTQQGKLVADDVKPDVTFRRDDVESRDMAEYLRRVLDYAWDEEFEAESAYIRATIKRLTYGVGGLRARWDPSFGPERAKIPLNANGEPQLDDQALSHLAEHGVLPDGSLPKFQSIREGRLLWEPLGPRNILPPPGVEHERDFPWLIIERPVWLPSLQGMYGQAAQNISEENIRLVETMGLAADGGDQPAPRGYAKLKQHAILYTGYEFPTPDHPEGRTFNWAQQTPLFRRDRLPFIVNGVGKAGVSFLKYQTIDGRFWPLGLVEPTIGPQRQRNVSRSQNIEIKDRMGLGRVYAHENAITETQHPKGLPAEVVIVRAGYDFPKETQGVGPGPWLAEEANMNDNDLRQVVGLGDISLSQVPSGVSAYSAFALLVEQDDRRIGPVRKSDRIAIADLVRVSIEGIREYWPDTRKITVGSTEDDLLDAFVFAKAQLPDQVYVKVPITAPLPQSQAAEAQLILDIFDRGISSGQPLPLDWLVDSFRLGRMQPLPKRDLKLQEDKADQENMLMAHGQQVQPAEYDNDELHIMRHRAAQSAYQVIAPAMPAYQGIVEIIEQHIAAHMQSAAQKQQMQAPQPNGMVQQPGQGVGGQNAGLGPLAASSGQGMPGGGPPQGAPVPFDIHAVTSSNRLSPRMPRGLQPR